MWLDLGSTKLRENNVLSSISVDLGASNTFQLSVCLGFYHCRRQHGMMIDDKQPTRWSGTKTHPYGEAFASKVSSQYEFMAVWRSAFVSKAVPVDTGLNLLAAVMRNRRRAREYLGRIMMLEV